MATLNMIWRDYELPCKVEAQSKTAPLKGVFELVKKVENGFEVCQNGETGFVSESPLDDYEVMQ